MRPYLFLLLTSFLFVGCLPEGPSPSSDPTFTASWPTDQSRTWIGTAYWANRLQDWQLEEGRLICVDARRPLRTVHMLTRALKPERGDLTMEATIGHTGNTTLSARDFAGFLIGAGSHTLDYRANALVHGAFGTNGGLAAVVDGKGYLRIYDNTDALRELGASNAPLALDWAAGIQLHLQLTPSEAGYTLKLDAVDGSGTSLAEATAVGLDPEILTGNVALLANGGANAEHRSFWFADWRGTGTKLQVDDARGFGPIAAAQHTLSRGTLKLTAQLMPLSETADTLTLEIYPIGQGNRKRTHQASINRPSYTATFRLDDWATDTAYAYTLHVAGEPNRYSGIIQVEPTQQDELVVAAFTGNNNSHGTINGRFVESDTSNPLGIAGRFNFTKNMLWFPHADLTEAVAKHEPDFLFFSGDQLYEGRPTPADQSGGPSSFLDYLYKWYLWCWTYGDLTNHIPAVTIPDDHDVYHGNIWGAGGIAARPYLDQVPDYPAHYQRNGFWRHWRQDGGGYKLPADFVRMVERTQTSHLPDPFDPTPVAQGIGVYYTDVLYGGVSFAVLEDRKFKASPSVVLPAYNVINGFAQVEGFTAEQARVPDAPLLGQRQLDFLEHWAADWEGTWMKVALSQSVFATLSTYPDTFLTDAGTPRLQPLPQGVIPADYSVSRDMDSNGWPKAGRDRALAKIRKGFGFMIGGDQHLGTVVHHGIDDWEDAGVSFCVPSVANLWPRRWFPPERGGNHQAGLPDYTGRYLDGFGNHVTVWAASNPYISNQDPHQLHDRAPGYGIVRLNKKAQTIRIENWPRYADPEDPAAEMYPGWPITFTVADNYGRDAEAYLPTLNVQGLTNPPVVQVIDEASREIVYTVRAPTTTFRPKVFAGGTYTLHVGEPGTTAMQTFTGVEATAHNEEALEVTF